MKNLMKIKDFKIVDLRQKQCPMLLVSLKCFLLQCENDLAYQDIRQVELLFSTGQAMKDIILYLDKKGYHYSTDMVEYTILLKFRKD